MRPTRDLHPSGTINEIFPNCWISCVKFCFWCVSMIMKQLFKEEISRNSKASRGGPQIKRTECFQKFWKEPLGGANILFCRRSWNCFTHNRYQFQNTVSCFSCHIIVWLDTLNFVIFVCLFLFFFATKTSEQHTATADLVNFFIFSFRVVWTCRLRQGVSDEQDRDGSYFIANGYITNHVPTRV